MSEVEPRTRRELIREVGVSALGGLILVAVLSTIQSDWSLTTKSLVVATIYLGSLVIGLTLRRRRLAGRLRLGRSQRRLLFRTLRGAGRLPASADDSWRPALRRAVIGLSFASNAVFFFALLAVPFFSDDSSSDPDGAIGSPVAVTILVLVGVVMVVMFAGFMSWLSRAHADNAQRMLDQLDARAADPVDA